MTALNTLKKVPVLIASATLSVAIIDVNFVQAAPVGFGVDTSLSLYSIDLGLGTANLIGSTGIFLEGIAINQNEDLYGTDTGGQLYNINPLNARTTLIGSTGRGNIEALDFLGDRLLGVDFNMRPTVFSIDVTNASTTSIVTVQNEIGAIRSGAVFNENTLIVRSDMNGLGSLGNFLHFIDLTTGSTTLIGSISNITAGLDFDTNGNLYGLRDNGDVIRISLPNVTETLVGNTGGQFWLGLAVLPDKTVSVPESSSVIGLGLLGLGLMLKKKAKVGL
jgi:hypothetical protein